MGTQIKTFAIGAAFTLLAAGFAYAVPLAIQLAADHGDDFTQGTELGTEGGDVGLLASPSPTGDGDEDADGRGDKDPRRPENHGAAAAVAARCELKGRAHGKLVRAVANDEDATVADAKAACEAAKAEAQSRAGLSSSPGKRSSRPDDPSVGGGQGRAHGRTPDAGHTGGGGDSTKPGGDAPSEPKPTKPTQPTKPDRPEKTSRP